MKSLLLSSLFVFSFNAFAQINFNNVTYSGTGCPQGTVSTAVSPDGSSLSILFDEFRVEVPQYQNKIPTNDQKSCALSFTATLPPGMMADKLEVTMQARGATILDQGVEGFFSSILVGYNGIARSKGSPTLIAVKQWRNRRTANVDENWTETPKPVVQLQSACSGTQGRDIRFDLKNHILAETPSGDVNKHGMITVDSNDVTGFLKFTLRTKPCR
jgi:hypothetical protein